MEKVKNPIKKVIDKVVCDWKKELLKYKNSMYDGCKSVCVYALDRKAVELVRRHSNQVLESEKKANVRCY